MALRLSGILMGGVVIVYERKVKLLYDDVNRLLVEINSAWKVKPSVDPTVLPKSKNQAKFEAVTLPENYDADIGDIQQSIDYSNKFTSSATFQQTAYFTMRLDTIDELTESFRENEQDDRHHQAEPANITITDRHDPFDSYQVGFNRFERFDIEGDEETQNNIPSHGQTEIPHANTTHSPPPEMEPQKDVGAGDIPDQQPVEQANLSPSQFRDARQKRKPQTKKARKAPLIMDIEQTMLPSNLYQTWLQDSSDIRVKRPTVVEHVKTKSAVKVAKLVDLPPVALSCGLVGKYDGVHYPQPLLDLWMTSMQPRQDSPSGRATSPHPPEPSSSSPPPRQDYREVREPEEHLRDFGNGVTAERSDLLNKVRNNLFPGMEMPFDDLNITANSVGTTNPNAAAANSSGNSIKSVSVHSTDLGPDFMSNTSVSYPQKSKNKRPSSTAGLESLDEVNPSIYDIAELNIPSLRKQPRPSFKMPRHSGHGPTPDHELVVETGITQTQRPAIDEEAEVKTNNIKTHLKTYFETPGAPQTESLNQLALGMNRKEAAQLFYQICVLVTRDELKVQQKLAYGDINISKGLKM